MDNKEFSKNLEKRTKEFAIAIFKLSALLPNSTEYKVVRNQLTKSGTSIGANYREANRARSKADFRNKIKICEGESSETIYWLDLISDMGIIEETDLFEVQKEASEFLAVFSSIAKNLKP